MMKEFCTPNAFFSHVGGKFVNEVPFITVHICSHLAFIIELCEVFSRSFPYKS